MNDWTNPHSNPAVHAPSWPPVLLEDQLCEAFEDRPRATDAEAVAQTEDAAQTESDHRATELARRPVGVSAHGGGNVLDVCLAFEAPARTSMSY